MLKPQNKDCSFVPLSLVLRWTCKIRNYPVKFSKFSEDFFLIVFLICATLFISPFLFPNKRNSIYTHYIASLSGTPSEE